MSNELLIMFLYIGPALIASMIYFKLANKQIKSLEFLITSIFVCFIVNAFTLGVLTVLDGGNIAASAYLNSMVNIVKYAGVSIVAVIAFPFIALLFTVIGRKKKNEK